jgi:hypothetical protein
MNPTQPIRGDSRADSDRAFAVALRGSPMRDAATLRAVCAGVVAVMGLLAAAAVAPAAVTFVPAGGAAMAPIEAAPVR